jgi:hypothetical protein
MSLMGGVGGPLISPYLRAKAGPRALVASRGAGYRELMRVLLYEDLEVPPTSGTAWSGCWRPCALGTWPRPSSRS